MKVEAKLVIYLLVYLQKMFGVQLFIYVCPVFFKSISKSPYCIDLLQQMRLYLTHKKDTYVKNKTFLG